MFDVTPKHIKLKYEIDYALQEISVNTFNINLRPTITVNKKLENKSQMCTCNAQTESKIGLTHCECVQ